MGGTRIARHLWLVERPPMRNTFPRGFCLDKEGQRMFKNPKILPRNLWCLSLSQAAAHLPALSWERLSLSSSCVHLVTFANKTSLSETDSWLFISLLSWRKNPQSFSSNRAYAKEWGLPSAWSLVSRLGGEKRLTPFYRTVTFCDSGALRLIPLCGIKLLNC